MWNEEYVGTGASPVQPSMCGNGRLRPFSRAQRGALRVAAMLLLRLQPSTALTIPNLHPSLPSPPNRRARHPLAKRLHSNCEATLHHRTHQGRHEVHLHPLRPPRQHSRFRFPRRQPPHAGSHGHQSPRHQRSPRACNVFLPRHPATHLAHLILEINFVIPSAPS